MSYGRPRRSPSPASIARHALLAALAVGSVACGLEHEPIEGLDVAGRDASRDAAIVRDARPDARLESDADPTLPGPDVVSPSEDATDPPRADVVTPPPRDVVAPPPDAPAPPIDVVAPPDAPPPPVDVVTPPMDVVTPPPDVPAPPVDVVTPPADAPRTCGRAGQPCCAGNTCEGSTLTCATFGGASACVPCGDLGHACCPGDTCGVGAMCRPLYSNAVRACVTNDTRGPRVGAPCAIPLGNCGENGLLCIGSNRSGFSEYARCLQCGGRGEPCCLQGSQCTGGATCTEFPGGIYFCR